MRLRSTVAAALVLLLVASASAGGAPPIIWAESFDKAVDEATLRNLPIICFYLDDKDKDCDKLRGGAFQNDKLVAFLNESCVCLVGHDAGGHKPILETDPKTKGQVERCPKYPGISCSVHERGFADAGGRFVWTSFPAIYICTPDGKLAIDQKELRDWGGELLRKKLEETQKKISGTPVVRSVLLAAKAELAKGDERLEKGKWLEAAKHYEKISKDKTKPEPVRKMAEKKLEELDAKGMAEVELAKGDKDKHVAIVKLRKLAADLKGRGPGEAAHAAADELEKAAAKPAPKPDEKKE